MSPGSLRFLFRNQGGSLLSRAADAETRRCLAITVLALERYRTVFQVYPASLPELRPQWLESEPIDFMDGKPLRYRRANDGHFVLYSVGLDCEDNGGRMEEPRPWAYAAGFGRPPTPPGSPDPVWPRPASAAEIEAAAQTDEPPRIRTDPGVP